MLLIKKQVLEKSKYYLIVCKNRKIVPIELKIKRNYKLMKIKEEKLFLERKTESKRNLKTY